MIRIYCAALIGAVIFLSYFVAAHVANVKCDSRNATSAREQIIKTMNTVENTNATVLHTGVGDIRRILHEKYTIAE